MMPFDATPEEKHRTARILRDGAAEVRKGWAQNALENRDGGVCAIGALNRATHGTALRGDRPFDDYEPARDALRKHLGFWDLVRWNNAPGRTKEQVAAAMEGAAEMVLS